MGVKYLKLFKAKKEELHEINNEFIQETINSNKIIHEVIAQFIKEKLYREKLDEVIKLEQKCDRLKEKYIQVLFKNKRALPFLIEDRYQIINRLDQINDKYEFFARFLKVFPYEPYKSIKNKFLEFNEACKETVKSLIDCAILIEDNFEEAYKKTFEVEANRRTARRYKFELLEIIFKETDDPFKKYLTTKLITYLYDVAFWAEDTSDFLRGLIIKYPSR